MKFLILIPFLISGCSAPSTNILYRTPEGKEFSLNLEKEYRAINLNISINPTTGVMSMTADSWESMNASVILAQSERDKAGAHLFNEGLETAIRAAIKSALPIP